MKSTELRIGNWVKRKEQPNGFQIESHSFIVCERDPSMYEPIPLTEEWLVRFGFVNEGRNWEYPKGNAQLEFMFEDGILEPYSYYTACPFDSKNKIKYVHQIQNIIFALTGQEL